MARRQKSAATPLPGEDIRPAVPARVNVIIRGGHRHRGVTYTADTPYVADAREAEHLRSFGALVEG